MHEFDPLTWLCKKCGISKREWNDSGGIVYSCTGREVDEEEFVRQTAEVEPDVVIDKVPLHSAS